ncbi:hypothetical protein B566_EDAN004572 [Ephemera danica]|nr:hypothetical protein B566_EDAN004572 [Ephemera danica]
MKHISSTDSTPLSEVSGSPNTSGDDASASSQEEAVLSEERFTVLQSSQPVSIRATYGPFSTKQTVPARYIVPDAMDVLPPPSSSSEQPDTPPTSSLDLDLYTHNLDISAHLVTPQVPRDSPVLRVLFHTGQQANPVGASPSSAAGVTASVSMRSRQRVCIVLYAALGDRPSEAAACSPGGDDGVCLAQLTVPASWWPPLPGPDYFSEPPHETKPINKTPRRLVRIAYSVFEPRGSEPCAPTPAARVQIQPVTALGAVPLVSAMAPYRELRADPGLAMLLPHTALYPRSRFYIPLFVQPRPGTPAVTVLVIRARVKSGLRVLGAQAASARWHVTVDINPKQTIATVTAFRRDAEAGPLPAQDPVASEAPPDEADEGSEPWEGGRIVWGIRYVLEGDTRFHGSGGSRTTPGALHHHGVSPEDAAAAHLALQQRRARLLKDGGGAAHDEDERRKLTARFDTQKDDIHAVLPIAKSWEVLNTAVLTGRQVSQAMKVFIVSRAGKIADVTLQASCRSAEESVLKSLITTTNTLMYPRRAVRCTWMVRKYAARAMLQFWYSMGHTQVWRVSLSGRLSSRSSSKVKRSTDELGYNKPGNGRSLHRGGGGWNDALVPDEKLQVEPPERPLCRLRFQQTNVEVYSRFYADDHDIGRISFFGSRRTWLRVTDLVLGLLRVSDSRIASLHGRILQGQSVGRTEVQVVSPVTGRVLGAKEVRVGSDRVTLTGLTVRVVSGLQLAITPDGISGVPATNNGYIATTSVTRRLTAQYQEGLLDIELRFSDDSHTPLRDVAVSDYVLSVESLDPEVVAFAPMAASPHPRVIAVGEGRGDLLRVTLRLHERCSASPSNRRGSTSRGGSRPPPSNASTLSAAFANVEVDFTASQRPEFVQNDGSEAGTTGSASRGRDLSDLHDILIGIPLKDENNHEPTVQARQHPAQRHHLPMTPLEIGMYVLLGAFCFAIVVFVVSCVVYASKFKQADVATRRTAIGAPHNLRMLQQQSTKRESTTNAHDWVWLGRATLERAGNRASAASNASVAAVRITSNPGFREPTSFDNPCHIELPSRGQPQPIDTSTYCKKPAVPPHRNDNMWHITEPPPLPPHGVTDNKVHETAMDASSLSPSDPDYKPPVPPHRNISVTARISPTPPPRPPRHGGKRGAARRQGVADVRLDEEGNQDELVFASEQRGAAQVALRSGGAAAEVKRANIVGNPMFSEREQDELMGSDVGLDLNLGMDYEQILEYFDNLKESNA